MQLSAVIPCSSPLPIPVFACCAAVSTVLVSKPPSIEFPALPDFDIRQKPSPIDHS